MSEEKASKAISHVRSEAMREYIHSRKTLETIAEEFSVDPEQLAVWYKEDKWAKKRSATIKDMYKRSEDDYRRFIAENRLTMLEDQHTTVMVMQEKMESLANRVDPEEKGASVELERLSRAMKNISDVGARVLSITDKPFVEDLLEDGRKPLIVINSAPPRAPDPDFITMKNVTPVRDVSEEGE